MPARARVPQSIRSVLRRSAVVAALVSIILACVVVAAFHLLTFRRDVAASLDARADIAEAVAAPAVHFADHELADETLGALAKDPNVLAAALYDGTGQRLAARHAAGTPPPDQLSASHDVMEFGLSEVSVTRPIELEAGRAGALFVRYDSSENFSALVRYLLIVVVVFAASGAAAIALSARFQRDLVERLEGVAKTAREVTASKNYALRSPATGSDEATDLAVATNAMLTEIERREDELVAAKERAERRTIELEAGMRRLEDAIEVHARVGARAHALHEQAVAPLTELLRVGSEAGQVQGESLAAAVRLVDRVRDGLSPLWAGRGADLSLRSARVLLAEPDRREQVVARMAVRGTGVTLDIVDSVEAGREKVAQESYDLVMVSRALVELAEISHRQRPEACIVLASSADASGDLELLGRYAFLSNIVARSAESRLLTVRSIMATVAKLCSKDLFGPEKYLSWGTDIREHAVTSSAGRGELLAHMEEYLTAAGIRRPVRHRATQIAEELLMNAIYDAPTDAQGKPLYSHLPRTVQVELAPASHARFRYACDGLVVAVAVEDPFGALRRETAVQYLGARQRGESGVLAPEKGGAGWGLFQIMKCSSMLVINVEQCRRTEVIALLSTDPEERATCAFSYFAR